MTRNRLIIEACALATLASQVADDGGDYVTRKKLADACATFWTAYDARVNAQNEVIQKWKKS